jgi:hypothetical protein
VAAVCDRSPGHLVVPTAGAWTICGSGPDGPQPGGRRDTFLARSPDGPSSWSDIPRWRGVVFFSSYDLDLVPWGRDLRVLRVSTSPGASPDYVHGDLFYRGSVPKNLVPVEKATKPDLFQPFPSLSNGHLDRVSLPLITRVTKTPQGPPHTWCLLLSFTNHLRNRMRKE